MVKPLLYLVFLQIQEVLLMAICITILPLINQKFIKAKNTGYIVKCGFMNMNKPTIRESLDAFRHEPIEALVVVPLFLAKGVHIEKDIPVEIGLPEGVKKGSFVLNGKSIPLVYADPIGSDPLLAELMVKNADKACSLL